MDDNVFQNNFDLVNSFEDDFLETCEKFKEKKVHPVVLSSHMIMFYLSLIKLNSKEWKKIAIDLIYEVENLKRKEK